MDHVIDRGHEPGSVKDCVDDSPERGCLGSPATESRAPGEHFRRDESRLPVASKRRIVILIAPLGNINKKVAARHLICATKGCYAFHRNLVTPGNWAICSTIGGDRMSSRSPRHETSQRTFRRGAASLLFDTTSQDLIWNPARDSMAGMSSSVGPAALRLTLSVAWRS